MRTRMQTQNSVPTGTQEDKDSKISTANKNERIFETDSSEDLFNNSEDKKDSSEKKDDTNL